MPVCTQCGEENPERARFCLACGAALEAEPAALREERKVVTVLFADLVGFTSTAEQLDPEEVRAVQAPYWARVKSEIERYGGTVEKFIGDAVMALFGAPTAHEDDPERAVRAAISIRDGIAGEEGLQVRIAVTTGEALVALGARPAEGEGMASGDVVNTASRRQSAAPPNGILVDEPTYRATERAIEYEPTEPVQAKGKAEPVEVWRAVAPRWRFGVDVEQRGPAELIGRGEELDVLSDALARARRERASQLVTLVGVPGIGKSRLVYELSQLIDADPELIYWRQGRSLPYGEGVTFWALAEMVKAHAGILETDTAEEAGAKLRAVASELIEDPADIDWVLGHMRPLVGLGGAPELGGERRAEVFAAWRKFFEALAERHALVLIFEDLQWADDGLLDFVDHVVEWASGVPLLCVCTARPELLERRPDWGGGKRNATTISLSPLSETETAQLLAALLEQAVLPAEVQSALLARAGGNPLYAEEYVRMLQDRGLDEATEAQLPESIQGIIAARLDALSIEEKDLLQDSAVLGKVVWVGALAQITGLPRWTVEERLHALERKEFVRREQHSSVAGETEYAFRHILVQDVAYGQIPRSRRAHKHRAAAEWIESLGSERGEERAELLAHHYLQALEYARAAGDDTAVLAEGARLALRNAGERAYALTAMNAALRFFSRPTSTAALFFPASLLIRSKAYVLCQLARMSMLAGKNKAAVDVGREALQMAEQLGIDSFQADALATIGTARVNVGDGGGIEDLERAVSLGAATKNMHTHGRALLNLGVILGGLGELDRVFELEQAALEAERSAGHVAAIRHVEGNLIKSLYWRGRWDEALQIADSFIGDAEAGSVHYMATQSYYHRAAIRLARGEESAVEDAERALEHARAAQDPQVVFPTLRFAAHVMQHAGESARAEEVWGELMQSWLEASDPLRHVGLAEAAWLAHDLGSEARFREGLSALTSTPWIEAAKAIAAGEPTRAARILGEIGARPEEAFTRLRSGDPAQVERALVFYRSVGAVRYVREGEMLLAATA